MPGDFDDAAHYEDDDLELDTDEREDDGDAQEPADRDDDRAPANAWASRRSLSDRLAEQDDDEEDGSQKSKGPTAQGSAAGEDDDDEEEHRQEQRRGEPPKKDDATEGTRPTTARFTRVDPEGKPIADPLLATGQVLRFKGDGKEITVSSDDELIQLAQKGAAFDRKTSELGRRAKELEEHNRSLQSTADQALMAVLFGYTDKDGNEVSPREAREQLRPKLARFRDPEVRAGLEALAREEAAKRTESEQRDQELTEARQEFWQQAGEEIRASLPEFEHLTPDHADDIAGRFYGLYERAFTRLVNGGASEEEAQAQAFEELTVPNLRRVMRGLNAELAESGSTPPRREAPRRQDPRAEAEAHNRRVAQKVDNRRTASRLQGGGAAPAGRPPAARESARATDREPLKPGETAFRRSFGGALSRLRSLAED